MLLLGKASWKGHMESKCRLEVCWRDQIESEWRLEAISKAQVESSLNRHVESNLHLEVSWKGQVESQRIPRSSKLDPRGAKLASRDPRELPS